jgi:hypothetical protein
LSFFAGYQHFYGGSTPSRRCSMGPLMAISSRRRQQVKECGSARNPKPKTKTDRLLFGILR